MMSSSPDPFHLANSAQNMARTAQGMDAKVFQKVALVSMCVMAAATATSVIRGIMHDLKQKDGPSHSRHHGR